MIAATGREDVSIGGLGINNITVQGNYIGVDKTGNKRLSDHTSGYGIEVTSGCTNVLIGGLTSTPGTGAGNVIESADIALNIKALRVL